MAKHQQLARPPLREALIDLRLVEELSIPAFGGIAERRPRGFESGVPIWRSSLTFQIGPAAAASPGVPQSTDNYGWRYASADGSRTLQLRRDGFTYSIVQGYTTWESARDSARELWREYCEWTQPTEVQRLAVRYINVVNLPPGADFDLYLTAGPRLPPEMPQALSGFLQRVVIPFAVDGTTAIVTQVLEPPKEGLIPVVLDIDVFVMTRFGVNSHGIWTTLDGLRNVKNEIFFSSVTEKALEPYK